MLAISTTVVLIMIHLAPIQCALLKHNFSGKLCPIQFPTSFFFQFKVNPISKFFFKPFLSPNSDQHQISLCNISMLIQPLKS